MTSTCLFCDQKSTHPTLILDERLFASSAAAHHSKNQVFLCPTHQTLALQGKLSVEELREKAGIQEPWLPSGWSPDLTTDRYGNAYVPMGGWSKGPLMDEPDVQQCLEEGGVLEFVPYVKYPSTLHVPWSPGLGRGDKQAQDVSSFKGREVVVSEKMDGESSSLYRDYTHARSIDGRHHPSRNWLKAFWAERCHELPEGWRVCGENVYAQHSIRYENLDSYFLGFSIWNEKNQCLSWAETLHWFNRLGITPVPVWYQGEFNEKIIQQLWKQQKEEACEGYVIRWAQGFNFPEFSNALAKFVRRGHVQTDEHWMQQKVIPNALKPKLSMKP